MGHRNPIVLSRRRRGPVLLFDLIEQMCVSSAYQEFRITCSEIHPGFKSCSQDICKLESDMNLHSLATAATRIQQRTKATEGSVIMIVGLRPHTPTLSMVGGHAWATQRGRGGCPLVLRMMTVAV